LHLHFEFQSTFMNKYTSIKLAARIWVMTITFGLLELFVALLIDEGGTLPAFAFFIVSFATIVLSLPGFAALFVMLPLLKSSSINAHKKFLCFSILLFIVAVVYALGICIFIFGTNLIRFAEINFADIKYFLLALGMLVLAILLSVIVNRTAILRYFNSSNSFQLFPEKIKYNTMETSQQSSSVAPASNNKTLMKGFITGGLILLMLIPTIFISNLISEREARQKEIVKEVSSKWATAQTLSCPFLVVPYSYTYQLTDGKTAIQNSQLIFLADTVNVAGNIFPEERQRSIYKVLLYRSDISYNGTFKLNLPKDVNPDGIDYANAKLCFSLSDYKGIEEDIYVQLNNEKLLLRPGLPLTDFGKNGLSAPIKLDATVLNAGLPFRMQVKLKGSEQLHFMPMASSSKFEVSSKWNDPSFDGEMLPSERIITQEGFKAKWSFNQANLPFSTVIQPNTIGEKKMDFGVSLVQPADQYGKTMRSVKYAILFIGLTFAFFFIIELMQKKPFHPVQYVLVGIALVIFYTLLLSISEYIKFDTAYIIAALATILLISLYAKGHFKSWRTAGIFFGLLSLLYAFIFVLIRLEDTALLVGSIGLFIVLALVMYASRRINWYGNTTSETGGLVQ